MKKTQDERIAEMTFVSIYPAGKRERVGNSPMGVQRKWLSQKIFNTCWQSPNLNTTITVGKLTQRDYESLLTHY